MTQLIRNVLDLVGSETGKYRIVKWGRFSVCIIPKEKIEEMKNNIYTYHIPVSIPNNDPDKARHLLKEHGFDVEFIH